MRFNLVRPCGHCPFRTDIPPFLTPGRVLEITDNLLADGSFPCHETIDYDAMEEVDEYESSFGAVVGPDASHCAGAILLLERMERPNQLMRIMERLRDGKTGRPYYDRERMDFDAPVYPDADAMYWATVEASGGKGRAPKSAARRTRRRP